jgi:hypothetical protein
MVDATVYRVMAAEHHRLAGMCRSPESREQHSRLEKELWALAGSEEKARTGHVPRSVRAIRKSADSADRVPRC